MDTINGDSGVANASSFVQMKHKFVGSKSSEISPLGRKPSAPIPVKVKESADVLLINVGEPFTIEMVRKAWKQQICLPEHHPDLGGNAEKAILLNTAKDELIRWLESNEPKLGRFFSKL